MGNNRCKEKNIKRTKPKREETSSKIEGQVKKKKNGSPRKGGKVGLKEKKVLSCQKETFFPPDPIMPGVARRCLRGQNQKVDLRKDRNKKKTSKGER